MNRFCCPGGERHGNCCDYRFDSVNDDNSSDDDWRLVIHKLDLSDTLAACSGMRVVPAGSFPLASFAYVPCAHAHG